MAEVVDSLVTELGYTADTKVLDRADKKLRELEKQSKATATATDVLAEEQLNLKRRVQAATEAEQKLRREQSKLRKEIRASKKPTDEQRAALNRVNNELEEARHKTQNYRNELKRLGIQQAKINRQARQERGQISELRSARQAAGGRLAAKGGGGLSLEGLSAAAAPATAAFAAVTTAAAVTSAAIGEVVETGARMETLRARLKTVEGSAGEAAQAFSLLRGIARETPFELEDVTNAYVRLKALGIQPTEQSLKAFGNVAAAQGKPIIDFIEAVADASTGEFERLKEFGIKASSQGEQVAFTFGGITTKVGKNAREITDFLEGLGETQFAGAMADQMNTFAGLVSNLRDTWTSFLDQIAQLGVLDEVKLLIKEISGSMSDDLAPIIAEVMVGLLQQLRELLVFLKGDSESLTERLEGLAETFNLILTALQPFLLIWKGLVAAFGLLVDMGTAVHGVLNTLLGLLGDLFDLVVGLVTPAEGLSLQFEGLERVWAGLVGAGDKLLGTISAVTGALFDQAGSLQSVNNAVKEFQALAGADGFKTKTDAELQKLRREGGAQAKAAEKEIARRVQEREKSEQQEARDARKKQRKKEQQQRAEDLTKDFSKVSDRQLQAFISDPRVPKKLRDKAEKEQLRREKKRRKKGAAAAKKLRDATLIADVEKQIEKNARELAQAEAARGLRAGRLTAADAGAFETRRFQEIQGQQLQQFRETGRLPAGIAQDVRQIAAIPSINDLAGRTQAPVISNTINNFDFRDNKFTAVVEGSFATSPQEFAQLSLTELRRQTQRLLGEAVPNFRTQEIR